ncbi:MAG TPA: NifU family protein [Pyrinomonadaceae bacterium]|jgi:Fe-S cluster biogenesis protein NfuA/nitrite reductase/ring-hydroxylating ferredoxin subunit|nr:NifU family protein [Pyrinomonadaceae bacterium]
MDKIEGLIRTIENLPDPAARASALGLVQALMEFHGSGLERMMELIADSGESGYAVFDKFAADDLVGSVLLLYGLHPLPLETRVTQALDKVRPYLDSHGGNVELLDIADGVVRLRLQGSCKTCPSSSMTLKLAIEEAIYAAAPDVVTIEAEGVTEPPTATGFVQIGKSSAAGGNGHKNGNGNGAGRSEHWTDVQELASLAQSSVELRDVSGRSILFCRLGETFYAYDSRCPSCDQPLQDARLELTNLVCPHCRQQYDVIRAGRGLDQPSLHLEPFPLLFEQGRARVALPPM